MLATQNGFAFYKGLLISVIGYGLAEYWTIIISCVTVYALFLLIKKYKEYKTKERRKRIKALRRELAIEFIAKRQVIKPINADFVRTHTKHRKKRLLGSIL